MAMPASTRAVCIAWQALKQPPITFSRGVRFPSYTHPRHSASCLRASAGNSSFDSGITRRVSVPSTVEESIQQALSACKQARGDGLMKLQLELLLPLIGATDLDDWPGGIQQQFKAATPVVSTLLGGLTDSEKSSGKADLKSYILDDGDAVGVWESEKVVLILFPNADCLDQVKSMNNINDRLLLFINPQWQAGQVVSDFGFGAQRKSKEEFIAQFSIVYYLKQLRVLGEDVKILKCYPGSWQVFVVEPNGITNSIAVEEEKPSYKRIQELLRQREGSRAGQSWLERLLGEFKFNQDSLKGN